MKNANVNPNPNPIQLPDARSELTKARQPKTLTSPLTTSNASLQRPPGGIVITNPPSSVWTENGCWRKDDGDAASTDWDFGEGSVACNSFTTRDCGYLHRRLTSANAKRSNLRFDRCVERARTPPASPTWLLGCCCCWGLPC